MKLSATMAIYVGTESREFYDIFSTLKTRFGELKILDNVLAALNFIKDHPVTHVVLNPRLSRKESRQAVEDINAEQPKIAVFAMGRSFSEVKEDNEYFIQKGIKATTFTFEQFIGATKEEEIRRFISPGEVLVGSILLGIVAFACLKIDIKACKYLANFWLVLLSAEFILYAAVSSWQRLRFRSKMNIPGVMINDTHTLASL